jgi:hypothetical protein
VLLLEFAAQGIRGVAPAGGRATLRPGYNVLAVEGGPLRRLLSALFHPSASDAEAFRSPGGAAGGAQRAGLTLVGDDRVTYRLVRDFAGGSQLHRFDPEKRSFVLLSQDLAEIAEALAGPVGVPAPSRLEALFSLATSELPSKATGAGLAAGPSLSVAPRAVLTGAAAARRLAELKDEAARAGKAEKLQYQLDGLQGRVFKLDEALKSGQRFKEGLAAAQADRAGLEPVARAAAELGDPAARLAAHKKACAKRDEAIARIAAERELLDEVQGRGQPQPPWKEPPFLAAAGAGVLLLLAGVLLGDSDLRYLSLLDIPAFGYAGWLALGWIEKLEPWDRVGRRRKIIDDWEQKVGAQFTRDTGDLQRALAALGLSKPEELREALERLSAADEALAAAQQRMAAWEADPETTEARTERSKLDAELRAVEAQLAEQAGGFLRDLQTIEAEMARVEADAAAPPPPAVEAAPARPATPAAGGGEPLRGLLERGAAELGGSPSSMARTLAAKASQVIGGLTLNRFSGVAADDRGNVQVVSGGRPTPAMTLPPAERDLVFIALKLALLDHALTASHGVVLLEDAFGGLPDGARRTVGRFLKQLAKSGQVLHATTDPAFREAADHQA